MVRKILSAQLVHHYGLDVHIPNQPKWYGIQESLALSLHSWYAGVVSGWPDVSTAINHVSSVNLVVIPFPKDSETPYLGSHTLCDPFHQKSPLYSSIDHCQLTAQSKHLRNIWTHDHLQGSQDPDYKNHSHNPKGVKQPLKEQPRNLPISQDTKHCNPNHTCTWLITSQETQDLVFHISICWQKETPKANQTLHLA